MSSCLKHKHKEYDLSFNSKFGLLTVFKTQSCRFISALVSMKILGRRPSLQTTVWIFQLSVQGLFLTFCYFKKKAFRLYKWLNVGLCVRVCPHRHFLHTRTEISVLKEKKWRRKPFCKGFCFTRHSYKTGLHLRRIRPQWTQHLWCLISSFHRLDS